MGPSYSKIQIKREKGRKKERIKKRTMLENSCMVLIFLIENYKPRKKEPLAYASFFFRIFKGLHSSQNKQKKKKIKGDT